MQNKNSKNSKILKNNIKSIAFTEKVRIPIETFTLNEQKNEATGKIEDVFIEGIAITFERPTRNRVSYTYQSGMNTHKTLIGKPLLDTHNDTSLRSHPPFGHIVDAWMGNNTETQLPTLFYRASIDPEETNIIRKIKRKDFGGCSIQVLVSEIFEKEDEGGEYIEANIAEFLEMSLVSIPGDADSSFAFAENFHKFKEGEINGPGIPDKKKDGTGPYGGTDACPKSEEGNYKNPVGGRRIGDTPEEEPEEIAKVKPLVGTGKEEIEEEDESENIDFNKKIAYKGADKQVEEEKAKQVKDLCPTKDNDDDEDSDEIEYKGNKVLYNNNENLIVERQITEAAVRGLKCQKCHKQLLKDNFIVPAINYETFQLRCSGCGRITAGNKEKFQQFLKEARERIKNVKK